MYCCKQVAMVRLSCCSYLRLGCSFCFFRMQISFAVLSCSNLAAFSCRNLAALSCTNLAALSCSNLAAHCLQQPCGLCFFMQIRFLAVCGFYVACLLPTIAGSLFSHCEYILAATFLLLQAIYGLAYHTICLLHKESNDNRYYRTKYYSYFYQAYEHI